MLRGLPLVVLRVGVFRGGKIEIPAPKCLLCSTFLARKKVVKKDVCLEVGLNDKYLDYKRTTNGRPYDLKLIV